MHWRRWVAGCVLCIGLLTGPAVAQSGLLVVPLANTAGEVSGTIRGSLYVLGAMADQDAMAADTRKVQGQTVRAAQAFQYSSNLATAATGSAVMAAANLTVLPSRVLLSRAGAMETAGIPSAAAQSGSVLTEPVTRYQERQSLFCAAGDPACGSVVGARPNGDRMPGAILAVRTLVAQQDEEMAAWVVSNLVGPIAVPALTAAQASASPGKRAFLTRGHMEAGVDLARDAISDILITQRDGSVDPSWYNSLAQESGLPQARGAVSIAEMRQMRDVSRFSPAYYARLAQLETEPLIREVLALKAQLLQQRSERADLLDKIALVRATELADRQWNALRDRADDAARR